jgi:hypothetical protein
MKKFKLLFLTFLLVFAFGVSGASADIVLFEWGLNLNGTVYNTSGSLPGYVDASGFDFTTGLGTIKIAYTAAFAGSYSFLSFFDHEMSEATNTYFNEFGSVSGVAVAGQSWEIDEPGYVFGDIYSNFTAGNLDNTNAVPVGAPDDVSMAMGWTLAMNPGDKANISFLVATSARAGFYLQQTDPDSAENIYFSGTGQVTPAGTGTVPEPGTLLLLGSGLLGLIGLGRKRYLKG